VVKTPVQVVSVQIDYKTMQRIRKIAFTRRVNKKKPWSQPGIFTEALQLWLNENPR